MPEINKANGTYRTKDGLGEELHAYAQVPFERVLPQLAMMIIILAWITDSINKTPFVSVLEFLILILGSMITFDIGARWYVKVAFGITLALFGWYGLRF